MTKEPRPHPDHEWLLLMSDGELAPEPRAVMQRHLEACWECRHELQQIESAIGDAVRYRKEVLVRHLPPPPNAWRDLSGGFAEIDRELQPPSLLSRISAALRMPRYAVPLAAAVLGAAMLVSRARVAVEPAPAAVPAVVTPDSAIPQQEPPARAAIGVEVGAVPSSIEPTSTPADPSDLAHSAVRVAQLLHERGADLGDPIEITSADGRVVVRGVGLDSARVHELEPLLKQIPFVEFLQSTAGGSGAATAVGRFASAGAPFQRELERALGGQANVDALTSECLDHADMMMARAHALRRLSEQFSTYTLSADDQRALQALRLEHANAVVAEVTRIERTLLPAMQALGGAPGPVPALPPSEENLLTAARKLEASIAELLGAKAVSGTVAEIPSRIATDMAATLSLAKSFAARN